MARRRLLTKQHSRGALIRKERLFTKRPSGEERLLERGRLFFCGGFYHYDKMSLLA